jgi:(S)-2-hydroxyglutarate dehydrogenase
VTASQELDVAVVGAGILGLATARRLLSDAPGLRIAVFEKEPRIASHQTGHNSGVVHSGIYYTPGSLKARFCHEGRLALEQLIAERQLPYERCGKVVVALSESELPRLAELKRRALANGADGLREIEPDELAELEPHAVGIRALHVPTTGIVDYGLVAAALRDDLEQAGARVVLGRQVTGIERRAHGVRITTEGESVDARALVACAGLQSDRLAALGGRRDGRPRIVPFRGDYYTLRPEAHALVNGLIYPVPDPALPFLGVHFTRTIDGRVLAGPNAVLALQREGYSRSAFDLRDTAATISYPGFWRFAIRHARFGAGELWRDAVKQAFVRDMQRYVPAVQSDDVELGPCGIRAQALDRNGKLLDDFALEEREHELHVLNAPSPGATSSLAIAGYLAERAAKLLA